MLDLTVLIASMIFIVALAKCERYPGRVTRLVSGSHGNPTLSNSSRSTTDHVPGESGGPVPRGVASMGPVGVQVCVQFQRR